MRSESGFEGSGDALGVPTGTFDVFLGLLGVPWGRQGAVRMPLVSFGRALGMRWDAFGVLWGSSGEPWASVKMFLGSLFGALVARGGSEVALGVLLVSLSGSEGCFSGPPGSQMCENAVPVDKIKGVLGVLPGWLGMPLGALGVLRGCLWEPFWGPYGGGLGHFSRSDR